MAAVAAVEAGARVALLEKNALPGRSYLLAAMGTGALSNRRLEIGRFTGREGRFVSDALACFRPADLVDWFARRGVNLVDYPHYGLIVPMGGPDAALGALVAALGTAELMLETRAAAATATTGGFAVALDDGRTLKCRRLVLACGGTNLPQLGGESAGLEIAQRFGHSIHPPRPLHVPLAHVEPWLHQLAGLWMDVELKLSQGAEVLARATGSILFTRAGLTGEAVFNLTADLSPGRDPQGMRLTVNFFPDLSTDDVAEWLHRTLGGRTQVPAAEALDDMLPRRLGDRLLERQKVKRNARARQVEQRQRQGLLQEMTGLHLTVAGTLGMRASEAMGGGVRLRQVNPRTMVSRLVPGLYFAGRMLDVTAPWGGFLQHFSLASGLVAGRCAGLGLDSGLESG